MTRMIWSRGKCGSGYSIERSPYRPYTPSELLRGRTEKTPPRPTALPAPAASAEPADGASVTLAYLARHGTNRLWICCGAYRIAQHRDLAGISADLMALPVGELGAAVRCEQFSASTMVSPFTEGARRDARP
ncbi:hypothetical protein [Ancylobacter terrae]|uniref:hypothetical protein n=1 Tax=Ancylobacter sp. sgz301288 TaxID=3342077 RepID=UPI00385D7B46